MADQENDLVSYRLERGEGLAGRLRVARRKGKEHNTKVFQQITGGILFSGTGNLGRFGFFISESRRTSIHDSIPLQMSARGNPSFHIKHVQKGFPRGLSGKCLAIVVALARECPRIEAIEGHRSLAPSPQRVPTGPNGSHSCFNYVLCRASNILS